MNPVSRQPRVLVVMALIVALAVIAMHWETLLTGRVYHMDDAADGYYPSHVAAGRAFAHGELPAWEPRAWCGWPLGADPYYAVFYPVTAAFYVSPSHALGYVVALHAIAAGLALAWLIRRRRGSYEAAIFGALSLALSTFVLERIRHVIFVQVLVWIVLALVGIEGFLQNGRRRELALAGVAAGMMLLCGALPLLPFAAILIAAYALPRAIRSDGKNLIAPRSVQRLGGLAIAAIIGLLIGGAQLFPTVAHLPLSPRALGTDFEFASSYAWPDLSYLALLVAPHIYGVADRARWFGAFNYWEMAGYYVGLWPVLLALIAIARPRSRGRPAIETIVLGLTVALSIVLAFGKGTPVHRFFFDHLPLYGGLRCPTRALVIFVVLVPLLGAEGLDTLLTSPVEKKWRAPALRIIAGLLLAALGASCVAFVWYSKAPHAPWELERNRGLATAIATLCIGCGVLVAAAGTAKLATVRRLFVIVNLLDLFVVGRQHIDAKPSDWATGTDHFWAIDWLEKQHSADRFIPDANGPFRLHNAGMTYDLPSAGGYDSVTTWFIVHYLWLINNRSPYPHAALKDDLAAGFVHRYDTPLIDLLNIRWAIAASPPTPKWIERFAPPAGKPLAVHEPMHDSRLRVYENPSVLPRAFVVFRAQVDAPAPPPTPSKQPVIKPALPVDPRADDKRAAAALLKINPRRTVLLDHAPVPAPSGEDRDMIPAVQTKNTRNQLAFTVDIPAPGVLVIADTYYPGWSARVDGKPAPILRADYAFRGVALAAGHHVIELHFTSLPTLLGLGATFLGLGAFLLLLLRRSRREISAVRRARAKL